MAGQVSKQKSPSLAITATILVILMLGTSASNLLVGDSQALVPDAENNYQSETVFTPEQNLTYVEYTDTGILQVPRNQTITDANLSLSSMWNPFPIKLALLEIIKLSCGMEIYPIPKFRQKLRI